MNAPAPIVSPDTATIMAAARGDTAALEALARRWWRRIRRWALAELGDPSLAEDAAQETLLRLCRTIHRVDAKRPFAPYLHRMTVNASRDIRRKRGPVQEPVTERWAPPTNLASQLDHQTSISHVWASFHHLTPRQRHVFDLIDLQGMTTTEAAALLSIKPATVRVLLHQARRTLREQLLQNPELIDVLRST